MDPMQGAVNRKRVDLGLLASEILGNLAFMVTDDDSCSSYANGVWMTGEVRYAGPSGGRVQCWCTRDFAIQLAANLLGTDPSDSEAWTDAEDALREFLNVLCGNLVTSAFGDEQVFKLTIPLVHECLEAPSLAANDPSSCRFNVDGQPVLMTHSQG